MTRKAEDGFSLAELLLVAGIVGVVFFAAVRLVRPLTTYMQRAPARQRAQLEMRICMETIQRVMSSGNSSSLVIATPDTTPTIQFSSATFQSLDGSTYSIYWANSPKNSVHLQRIPPGGSPLDSVLATHITALVFGIAVNDPGIVYVTLKMTTPLDASGSPDSFYTSLLPTQTIQMASQ